MKSLQRRYNVWQIWFYVLFHSPYLLLLYFDPMKIVIVVSDGNRTFLIPSVIQKNGESYYLNVV